MFANHVDTAVLQTHVNWQQYASEGLGADFLSLADVEVLQYYEGNDDEAVAELMATEAATSPTSGPAFARVLLKSLSKITDGSVLRFTLTRIEHILAFREHKQAQSFAAMFASDAQVFAEGTAALLRVLEGSAGTSSDGAESAFIMKKAAMVLAHLLTALYDSKAGVEGGGYAIAVRDQVGC